MRREDGASAVSQLFAERGTFGEIWSQVVSAMREASAPPIVIAEAEGMQNALHAALSEKAISDTEREQLVSLAREYDTLKDQDVETLLSRVPPEMQSRIRQYREAHITYRSNWSWGACAFCGALGFVELGFVGGAIGCLVCGAWAK
jgi:hypothetical protein